MPLLAAYDLRHQAQRKVLFDGASLGVEPRDRWGLVGANGTGKTTLLRILAGDTVPDGGRIVRARGLRIGYLPQEARPAGDQRLLESVLAAAPRRAELEERLAAAQEDVEHCDEPERQLALAAEVAELTNELADLDRHFAPHHARRILFGLGWSDADFDRPLASFSGGWRMRAALAGLLFRQPDVLLLDEPTNHLDMPSVHWLNRFLDGFPHALVLVCHDREFLNRHVDRIAALEPEGLKTYRGDYDRYQEHRRLELEGMEAQAKRDERKRRDLEEFVTRFKAKASKARQAQSKARLIEKLTEQMPDLPPPRRTVRISFPPAERSGDPVVEIEGLRFAYGGAAVRPVRPVLDDVRLEVRRGDRIVIVGLNGAGKTTLLKLIAGELAPQKGDIRFGHAVRKSYFAQHHAEMLDPKRAVLDEVAARAPGLAQSQVRGLCGAFLFSGDEVEKPVGVLSGGEKTRVALACMLAAPGNLLLLDEPTNHLDTESAERLTDSLERFDGTILFVSHDLAFARRLATRVWDVAGGTVRRWEGSLADYLERVAAAQDETASRDGHPGGDGAAARGANRAARTERPARATAADDKAARVRAREELSARRKERARLEKRVAELERAVAAAEDEKRSLEARLGDPAVYADKLLAADLAARHVQVRAHLERDVAAWEEAAARLDALPADSPEGDATRAG